MQAIADKMTDKPIPAYHRLTAVLSVLEWGNRVWSTVPKADRGSIFEKSFVRAVKLARLRVVLTVYSLPLLLNALLKIASSVCTRKFG